MGRMLTIDGNLDVWSPGSVPVEWDGGRDRGERKDGQIIINFCSLQSAEQSTKCKSKLIHKAHNKLALEVCKLDTKYCSMTLKHIGQLDLHYSIVL